MLRRRDFRGSITMLSDDAAPPVDRPNLSKDYLAGGAPEDWLPLRPDDFYPQNNIDLHLNAAVVAIDAKARQVRTAAGQGIAYDRLLLATGAEPVRLNIPGADQRHVHTLRSLADCRAIIAAAGGARRALVIGASFIGLEVAASLRTRGIEVHVVAPEARPMVLRDFWPSDLAKHSVKHSLSKIASAPAPQSKYKVLWSLIMAAPDGHHGVRQAGAPGVMRAAPGQGPVVRVHAEPKQESGPGLVSSLKGLLRPLWGSGSDKARASGN